MDFNDRSTGSGCLPIQAGYPLRWQYTHGQAAVQFACGPGYTMLGPRRLYCDGRAWSSRTPRCRGTFVRQ
jgi:hypothetical protein